MKAGELDLALRWMPFELDPDTPPAGTTLEHRMESVYGYPPEDARAAVAKMRDAAREAGFPLDYTGGDNPAPEPMMWNTFAAHKLLRWAFAYRGETAQTALKLALFDAHFRQRRNVSDPAVLCEIAGGVEGLWAEGAAEALADPTLEMAVRVEQGRAREAGLSSVPTFVVAGKYALQGAQPPEALVDAFRQIAAREAAA